MASLSVVFTEAINEWGWLEENPALKVKKKKEPRGRVRFLSDEERAVLLDACKNASNPNLYIVVALALTTGARFSEIINLKWEHVDLKRRVLYFLDTKNKDRRSVPISQHAYDLLEQHKKVRRIDTKYVFPGKEGNKPLELKRQWENVVRDAKLKDFRFHDLRHTAASYLAMNGASLLDISHILGHRTLQMVQRYSHLTENHVAGVLERMNEAQFGNLEVKSSGS
ncbi:MAG: site-specific integrase [Candidatus Gastranaerophilales bacterium]|nr:site-specific integrase [Candidatus Gastranaerophilales bacterium]